MAISGTEDFKLEQCFAIIFFLVKMRYMSEEACFDKKNVYKLTKRLSRIDCQRSGNTRTLEERMSKENISGSRVNNEGHAYSFLGIARIRHYWFPRNR